MSLLCYLKNVVYAKIASPTLTCHKQAKFHIFPRPDLEIFRVNPISTIRAQPGRTNKLKTQVAQMPSSKRHA